MQLANALPRKVRVRASSLAARHLLDVRTLDRGSERRPAIPVLSLILQIPAWLQGIWPLRAWGYSVGKTAGDCLKPPERHVDWRAIGAQTAKLVEGLRCCKRDDLLEARQYDRLGSRLACEVGP
jgi:hypothetical protein